MSFQLDLLPAEKKLLNNIKEEIKKLTKRALHDNLKRIQGISERVKTMEEDSKFRELILRRIREDNSLYDFIIRKDNPITLSIRQNIYKTVYHFEDYLKFHAMKGIFNSIGTQLKLVDHSFNMFYVNISEIYDVKYIMYDSLLELTFNIIKNSKIRVLTHEQETKIELYYGEHELFSKIGKIQEKLSSSDITKDEEEKLNNELTPLLKEMEYYEEKLEDIELTNEMFDNYTLVKAIKPYYHQELLIPDLTKVVIIVDGYEWVRSHEWIHNHGRQILLSPIFNFATHETHLEILGQNRVTKEYEFKLKT